MNNPRQRKNFSKKTILDRFAFSQGRCEKCGVKVKPGGYHADHDNPDGLTGEPTFHNCRILCLACHAEKTPQDVAHINEAKRREWKHHGPRRKTALSGSPKRRATTPVEKLSGLPRNAWGIE